MSIYSTGDIAKACNASVRTVQYYDNQGILSPHQVSDSNRCLYTDEEVEKLELIIVLKELGCSIKEVKTLLKNEETLKTLNAILEIKEEELRKSIRTKESMINKITSIRNYINTTSLSPIHHLRDIDYIMKESHNLKNFRKTLWISTGIIGSIQYAGLIATMVTKSKTPVVSTISISIFYAIGLTHYYKSKVSYLCLNCQNVFNPTTFEFIKAQHTPKTRKFICPKCHETHFCVEVAKH